MRARRSGTSRTRSSTTPRSARSSRPRRQKLKPQITGPHQGDIQTAVTNAIQRVEQKKQSSTEAWAQFLKDVANVAT